MDGLNRNKNKKKTKVGRDVEKRAVYLRLGYETCTPGKFSQGRGLIGQGGYSGRGANLGEVIYKDLACPWLLR